MWFSNTDSVSFWQPLFHIRSLDGSTTALIPSGRYCISAALTKLLQLLLISCFTYGTYFSEATPAGPSRGTPWKLLEQDLFRLNAVPTLQRNEGMLRMLLYY